MPKCPSSGASGPAIGHPKPSPGASYGTSHTSPNKNKSPGSSYRPGPVTGHPIRAQMRYQTERYTAKTVNLLCLVPASLLLDINSIIKK